jgi:hypothetical protein
MTWSFRQGAIVTYTREDGLPGPGNQEKYTVMDGWKVELQDEGCVQITNHKKQPSVFTVVPWHRIYEVRAAD